MSRLSNFALGFSAVKLLGCLALLQLPVSVAWSQSNNKAPALPPPTYLAPAATAGQSVSPTNRTDAILQASRPQQPLQARLPAMAIPTGYQPPPAVGAGAIPAPLPAAEPAAGVKKAEPLPASPPSAATAGESPKLAGPLMSLAQLEGLALANHPQIIGANEQLVASHGLAIQAGKYPNPVVGIASPQLAGNQSQYNGFVAQDIVTRGKLKLNAAAAYQQVEQSELAIVRARFDVLTGVRQQFYATLASQQRVFVLQELVRIATRSRTIGEALLKGGEGTKTDTLLLDIELNKAQVALLNAETVLSTNRRQLAAALGLPQTEIGNLAGDLSIALPELDLLAIQNEARQNNALAGIAQAEIRRNEYLLQRAIVEPFPNINIMGGYQRQLLQYRDQAIFQVTLPLPLWNRNQGNIQAAQATLRKSNADFQQVQVNLSAMAADALARYRTSQQLVQRYQAEILPKSRESLKLTQRLYEEGQIDFLRLLQSQRTLNEVNLGYIDSQENRWKAAADIASLLQVDRLSEAPAPPLPVPAADAVPPK